MRKPPYGLATAALLILSLSLAACGGPAVPSAVPATAPSIIPTSTSSEEAGPTMTAPAPAATSPSPSLTASASPTVAVSGPAVIPNAGAPEAPTSGLQFSRPTEISNPLYPVSSIGLSIFLGTDRGKPARQEVTLLPTPVDIAWNGRSIAAVEVQAVAYTDGRLAEVDHSYFAQADSGGVYLMGQDIGVYEGGEILSRSGSWRAGKDGAAPVLVMPAHPQAGQVFESDNLANMAYQAQGVLSVASSTRTPAGPVDNGVLVKAVMKNGDIENRVYAAGWGQVEARSADKELGLVLLNRADSAPGSVPKPLADIEAQSEDIMDSVPGARWEQVAADLTVLNQAWQAYQPQTVKDQVPQPFLTALTDAAGRLKTASATRDGSATLQAANDLSAAVVDLYTVYRPPIPADLGRLDVLERQVGFDVAANNLAAGKESLAQVGVVWARLKPFVLAHQASDVPTQFDNSLAKQQAALTSGDASALTTNANASLELVDALERQY